MSTYRWRIRDIGHNISHLHHVGGHQHSGQNPIQGPVSGQVPLGGGLTLGLGAADYEHLVDYSDPAVRAFHPVDHYRGYVGLCTMTFNTMCYLNHVSTYRYDLSYGFWDTEAIDVPWGPMINDLASQISSSIQTNSLLLVTLAELGKTIRMVKNPFSLLKSDWRKRAGQSSAAALAKRGSSIWLEAQYGWKSAYADIKNFCASAQKFESTSANSQLGPESTRFSKSCTFQDKSAFIAGLSDAAFAARQRPEEYNNNVGYSLRGWQARISPRTCFAVVGCKRYLSAQHCAGKLKLALEALGCTSRSLLSTLWELTPWSFVVDWFVDAQGIASLPGSIARLRSADCHDLGYSTKSTRSIGFRGIPTGGISALTAPCGGGYPAHWADTASIEWAASARTYHRVKGIPTLSVTDFLDQNGLSGIQKANGIGLIIQKLIR